MDKIKIDCTYDLAEIITTLLDDSHDYDLISVYGKYDVIKMLLEDLIMGGIPIANEIELCDYDVDHYDKEFVLYIGEKGINVEKTWNKDNGYVYGGADITFVHEDCSSKLLKYIDSETVYEFGFDDGECSCSECKCNNREVKPVVKEKYTINDKEVSKKTYDESVKDALERFHEILDEMEEFRKIFFW